MTLIESRGVKAALVEAILAARDRARELGDEFGRLDFLAAHAPPAPSHPAALQGDSAYRRGLESRAGPNPAPPPFDTPTRTPR